MSSSMFYVKASDRNDYAMCDGVGISYRWLRGSKATAYPFRTMEEATPILETMRVLYPSQTWDVVPALPPYTERTRK